MRRVAELALWAAVLLLSPLCCHAGRKVRPVQEDADCVSARIGYSYSRRDPKVATCSRAQDLEESTQALQRQVDSLAAETETSLGDQGDKVKDLREDVDTLQGKNTQLTLFSAFIQLDKSRPPQLSDFRVFCEIYTYSEAMELARDVFRIDNPNPHWVHLDCQPQCPTSFWKIRPNCYRPNDPVEDGDRSPLDKCFYDPIPLNETCTRLVYLGGNGFTTNLTFRLGGPGRGSDELPTPWDARYDPQGLSKGMQVQMTRP